MAAQILFVDTTNSNSLNWYINTKTGPQSGSIGSDPTPVALPSNALSIGWETTSGFTGTAYWLVNSSAARQNYAYVVSVYPPDSTQDQRVAAMRAVLGHDAGDVDELAAVVAVSAAMWTNNSQNDGQWVYENGSPVSGDAPIGSNVKKNLPTTPPVYCGWMVSGFQGRMLMKINQTPPTGAGVQFTLDDQQ